MGKMVIEQENNKNYLVCRVSAEEEIDEDCLAAISEEETDEGKQGISGIIPISYSQMFEEKILRYDINAYISLEEYKKRITTKEEISKLFLSIIYTYEQAEAYLLDVSYFILEEQYIFINELTGKAYLILYPLLAQKQQVDFRKLFVQVMNDVRLSENDMSFYGKVMLELNHADTFTILKFKEILNMPNEEKAIKELEPNRTVQKPVNAYENSAMNYRNGNEKSVMDYQNQESFRKDKGRGSQGNPSFLPQQFPPYGTNPSMIKNEPPDFAQQKGAKDSGGGIIKSLFHGKKEKPEKVKKAEKAGKLEKEAKNEKKAEAEKAKKQEKSKNKINKRSSIVLPDEEEIPQDTKWMPKPPVRDSNSTSQSSSTAADISRTYPTGNFGFIPMTEDELTYGQTDDEPGYGGTEEEEVRKYLILYYVNEKKRIVVQQFPFEIGREANGCRINEAKTKVSRHHAKIVISPNGFQICDTSKHGTWINGEKMEKGVMVTLINGMHLNLKGEEFEVIIGEN